MINFFQKNKKLVFLASDVLLVAFSVVAAFMLRFDGKVSAEYFPAIQALIAMVLSFLLPIFYFQKLYSFSWSYVSTQELISLVKGIFFAFSLTIVMLYVLRDLPVFFGFPRSTIFISYSLIFLLAGAARFAKRIYLFSIKSERDEKQARTLIVGAGDAGEQILRSIIGSKSSPYSAVGFADDDGLKIGNRIHGVQVLGRIDDIPKIVASHKIEEIIVALPTAGSAEIKKAVELGRSAKIEKIKVVPSISEIIGGRISIANVRDVEVEDLLEREPITLDTGVIGNFINGKIILITGAAGSIGSELCRQVAKFKPSLLMLLDQDETGVFNIVKDLRNNFADLHIKSAVVDICDGNRIGRIFNKYRPNIVFHAAAYKHVPLMESQPDEAVKNNIFGTKTVAEAALNSRAEKFIFISTDKAVNPTSVMGASKRIGEMICQNLNQRNSTKFISLRFGNVLNSRGSVIPIFREQIKKGGPVEVTHPDMLRYFMLTSEACLLVMQAGAMGQGGEVFVLDMGKPVKILDLAREMISLSGFVPDKDIPIVYIGVRPGEKLFEEILTTAEEGTIATQNDKIFIAKLAAVNPDRLRAGLEKLNAAAKSQNRQEIVTILKKLIPRYAPHDNK